MMAEKELNYKHNCGWVKFVYARYKQDNHTREWLRKMFCVNEAELSPWLKRYGVIE